MRKKSEMRCLRAALALATVAMVTGMDTDAFYGPKMAAGAESIVRPKMAAGGGGQEWRRSRRSVSLFDPSSLYDVSIGRHQILKRDRPEDGLVYGSDEDDTFFPIMQQSPIPAKRSLLWGPAGSDLRFGPPSQHPVFSSRSSLVILDRPGRRKYHHRLTSGSQADDDVAPFLRSRMGQQQQHHRGGRLGFGSSRRFDDLGEAWRQRSSQKPWRHYRDLEMRPQNYFLALKRQPPPGFHAIRGKRSSEYDVDKETETETETEPENDVGIPVGEFTDTFGDLFDEVSS